MFELEVLLHLPFGGCLPCFVASLGNGKDDEEGGGKGDAALGGHALGE